MANSIDFLKQTKSLNTDVSSIGSEQKSVKDKPSLFDSLLSGNKTSSTQISADTGVSSPDSKTELTNSDVKKADIVKTKDKPSSVDSKEVDNTDSNEDANIEKALVKEEKVSSTSSLLDRLVLEAKKEVKNLDSKTTTAQIVSQPLDNEEAISPDTKIELTNNDIKADIGKLKDNLNSLDNKIQESTDLNKAVNNDNKAVVKEENLTNKSSLLGLESKTVNKEELKNLDTKINITQVSSETLDTLDDTEIVNKDTKAEVNNILTSLDNKKIDDTNLTDDANIVDKAIVKENKATSTNSLLDRLVLEAKKEVKTGNQDQVKGLDTKNTKTNTTQTESKISDNVESVSLDTKTETINSDVLNTLVSETKKDTKVVNKEELKNSKKDITETLKNSDNSSLTVDKKLNITVKDIKNVELNLEVPISKEKEADKIESKIDDKEISFETNKAELNTDKVLIDVENNISINTNKNSEIDFLNNSKINISNTISVPLSDTLNLQNTTVSTRNIQAKSLMDQLIEKNTQSIDSISPDNINMMERENASKDFISNIYLSTQKNSINTQNLFNKNEAINLLKDATNIKDVKTSAQMLDLGLEDVIVDQTVETKDIIDKPKKFDIDLVSKRNILDNLMTNKNIVDTGVKSLIIKSVEASNALIDDSLNVSDDTVVNVNSPISYNIQSKIIGARQQMSTMMSDIAKQMYENYKPPVTVFKINLNPLELGSIAILMKNDKNNSLSISMNVSNNSTLDALIDNQNVLKTSLNKNFDENTKFNLNFSSSNENNSQSSNQNNQNNQGNQNRFEQQIDTQSILELKEENKDREEKSIDYM